MYHNRARGLPFRDIGSEELVLHSKGIYIQHLPNFQAIRVENKQDSEGKLALKSKQVEKVAACCLFFVPFAVSFLGYI